MSSTRAGRGIYKIRLGVSSVHMGRKRAQEYRIGIEYEQDAYIIYWLDTMKVATVGASADQCDMEMQRPERRSIDSCNVHVPIFVVESRWNDSSVQWYAHISIPVSKFEYAFS